MLSFITKILDSIYYALYVFFESIFKTSHSWPTIISVTGVLTVIIAFPVVKATIDSPYSFVIFLLSTGGVDWLLNKYYKPRCAKIEKRMKKDNILTRIIYGISGFLLIVLMMYIICID